MGIKIGTPCTESNIRCVTTSYEEGPHSVDANTFVEVESMGESQAKIRDYSGLSMIIPKAYLSKYIIAEMPTEKEIAKDKRLFYVRIIVKVLYYITLITLPFIVCVGILPQTSITIDTKLLMIFLCFFIFFGITLIFMVVNAYMENHIPYYTPDNLKELAILLDYKKPKLQPPTADFIGLAEVIAEVLENREFDDVTQNSGYFLLKQLSTDCGLYVDVHKSTLDGAEKPHYVIYCSDDNENTDYHYTKDLTVISLAKEFEDIVNYWK